jgi:hypothetical protein
VFEIRKHPQTPDNNLRIDLLTKVDGQTAVANHPNFGLILEGLPDERQPLIRRKEQVL